MIITEPVANFLQLNNETLKCSICSHKFTCSTLYNVKKYVLKHLRKNHGKLYANHQKASKIMPSKRKNYLSKTIITFQKCSHANFKCSFGESFVCIQPIKIKQFATNATAIWPWANGMKILLVIFDSSTRSCTTFGRV